MKLVTIIIRDSQYFPTKEALIAENFFSLNTYRVLGRGKEQKNFEINDNTDTAKICAQYPFVNKRMIEIYVDDDNLERLIATVLQVNQQGNAGDGKIFVTPLKEAIRIRTKETGVEALI